MTPNFYGMLSDLGDTIGQNRARNDLARSLADLGPNPDYAAAAVKLMPTNPQMAMTLAQLGYAQSMDKRNYDFRVAESQRDQQNKDRDFGKPQIIGSAETGYYAINRTPNGVSAVGGPGAGPGMHGAPGNAPPGGMQPLIPGKPSALTREQEKAYAARVKNFDDAAHSAREMTSDIAQMRGLRGGVSYEGGWFPDVRTNIGQGLGLKSGMLGIPSGQEAGNAAALRSKAVDLQLGFSEKTKGAITDREQAMFAGATPGLHMADEGANLVFDGQEAALNRTIERSKFYQTYLQRNRTLAGADDVWDSYIKANPVFSRGKDGKLVINKGNVSNWQSYVGGEDPQPQGQRQAPGGAGAGPGYRPESIVSPDGTITVNPAGRAPQSGAQPPPSQQPKQAAPVMPKKGEVRDGYEYIGGNPANPASWRKQ